MVLQDYIEIKSYMDLPPALHQALIRTFSYFWLNYYEQTVKL